MIQYDYEAKLPISSTNFKLLIFVQPVVTFSDLLGSSRSNIPINDFLVFTTPADT